MRECGAAGDGHADDTQSILKAVDQLPEAGGVLYFPPGTMSRPPHLLVPLAGRDNHCRSCPLAGQYLLKQHLLIHDKPITIRGEGVGLSKLVWAEDAASVGIVISQGARQGDQTDFTRVQHLSFYTMQKDVGEG